MHEYMCLLMFSYVLNLVLVCVQLELNLEHDKTTKYELNITKIKVRKCRMANFRKRSWAC